MIFHNMSLFLTKNNILIIKLLKHYYFCINLLLSLWDEAKFQFKFFFWIIIIETCHFSFFNFKETRAKKLNFCIL